MRMGQGVRTGLGHGGITCVLQTQFSSFVNGAACDSFQFVWNCFYLFVQITCNACCTNAVPTESKLLVPVDFDHYSMIVVQILLVSVFWDLIFDLLKCIL